MPIRHLSGPLCLAATALLFAGTSSAQNPAGAQASGQGTVAADRSGAGAQGSAAGAAQAATLANTGAAQKAASSDGGLAGGAFAGLVALLAAAWLKRRELFGRSVR